MGFWTWNKQLPTGPMGVPLLNFVAWGTAVLPFAFVFFWRQTRLGLGELEIVAMKHQLWLYPRVAMVLGAAAVLFLATMTAIEGGMTGPTYGILYETMSRWGWLAPDLVWAPGA